MSALPVRRAQFKTGAFAAWLAAGGAEVGKPTNPYEVIRYRAYWNGSKRAVTHIVYAKENGLLTFAHGSAEHYCAFQAGDALTTQVERASAPVNPHPGKIVSQGDKLRAKLLERDGPDCWFCGAVMGDDCTVEHLIPRAAGGRDSKANYALAHRRCNALAADKPLVEKLELRQQLRARASADAS